MIIRHKIYDARQCEQCGYFMPHAITGIVNQVVVDNYNELFLTSEIEFTCLMCATTQVYQHENIKEAHKILRFKSVKIETDTFKNEGTNILDMIKNHGNLVE